MNNYGQVKDLPMPSVLIGNVLKDSVLKDSVLKGSELIGAVLKGLLQKGAALISFGSVRMLLLCLAMGWSIISVAAIDTYDFASDENRKQFKTLTDELRCPKCQNQNLADSNSPIASDMRREIHRMVEEGQSNQQVVDFMVARYGDFVRYRPKRDSSTALLWYGPIVLLVFGGLVVLVISRRRGAEEGKPNRNLADTDQERLKRLLDEDEPKD